MALDGTLIDQESTFASSSWGLDRRISKAVMKLGFVHPTLVQSRAVPLALEGKDLLVRARTGSGKTLAYSMPLLHKILVSKGLPEGAEAAIRAVVLVPTRELCEQTRAHIWELMHYCRDVVKVVALGSESVATQRSWLRERPDILVATPGRLVAHLRAADGGKGPSELGADLRRTVETLVVDEADLVFSYGYAEDIRTIVAHLPRICQSFLMSATLSEDLEKLKKVVLHSPVVLKLEEGNTDGELVQWYVSMRSKDKDMLIYALLKLNLIVGKTIFFVNSVDRCYRLKLLLEQFSVRSAVLNAELPERSRLHILNEFNKGIFDNLIATDESVAQVLGDGEGKSDEEDEDERVEGENGKENEDNEDEEDGDDVEDDEDDDDDDEEQDDDDEENSEDEIDDDEDVGVKKNDRKQGDGEDESNVGNDKSSDLEDEGESSKRANVKSRKRRRGDGDFGVARGVDFRGVTTVINVDFPLSATSYTHRIGRTARGGATGTALSFVNFEDPSQMKILREVQDSQPHLPSNNPAVAAASANTEDSDRGDEVPAAATVAQPAPLALDMAEIERFRYRVDDVRRAVTRAAVRDARIRELKHEMLNSERLEGHFSENPRDLQMLQHDALLLPNRVQPHVGHVPSYLMPSNIAASESALSGVSKGTTRRKRKNDGNDAHRSSAGRVKWKQRRKRGKFSTKAKKKRDALW